MNGPEESGPGLVMEYNHHAGVRKIRVRGIGLPLASERKQAKKKKLPCNLKYNGSSCVKVFLLILFINKFNVVSALFSTGLKYRAVRHF